MSPKIVNGSFAAIFDADEFLAKAYAGIRANVSFCFKIFFEAKWIHTSLKDKISYVDRFSSLINCFIFTESKFTSDATKS